METCFKILQLKFGQKLTHRCIALVRIPMIPVSDSGYFDRASRAGYFLL
jgi:hypothetical protein